MATSLSSGPAVQVAEEREDGQVRLVHEEVAGMHASTLWADRQGGRGVLVGMRNSHLAAPLVNSSKHVHPSTKLSGLARISSNIALHYLH